jgi:antiviral helicase SLH1
VARRARQRAALTLCRFITGLVDSLNAEVALGTVNSLDDGQTWLSYTYMFTRMKRNPLGYGMAHTEVADDPHLGAKRLQLIQSAARRLVACKMLELDEAKGRLTITDLGRVAAKYYIPNRTVEIFNEKLRPHMSEADVLSVLSLATDFEQIIPRETEEKELKKMQENAPCEVPGGFGHSPGKVNVLLQAYISKVYIEDFALVSDSAYVAQNAGRIIRALLEVALSRKWAPVTAALMSMSKAVERRMWPFEHPLSVEQSKLSPDTVYNITRWADDVDVATFASMSAADIGTLIHLNERQGGFVRQAARHFPVISAEYALRPLTHDLLRIVVDVSRDFEWSERLHGGAEPFLVWVEEETGVEILQSHRLLLRPQAAKTSVSFVVSVPQPLPAGMTVRWISDRWLGAEDQLWMPFDELVMPSAPPAHLALADVPLLQVGPALGTHVVESIYSHRFKAFNAVQTQVFHTMLHSRADALLCAPSASGKSTMSEMAIWRALREDRLACVLVLHPLRTLSLAHADAFRSRFADLAGLAVRPARWPRDLAPPSPPKPTVVYATPACVLRALSEEGHSVLEHFNLVVVEDVHLLDAPLELLLSKMRRVISREHTRLVVTSASLADASGLQEWLDIKPAATFSFHPSDSPSPLRISFQSFDLPHSVTLLKAMAKPAYDRMKAAVASGPAMVFVPSRAQCLGTATDLSTRSATDMETESFLRVDVRELEPLFDALSDRALVDPLLHGIGVWHEGMSPRDQALMLDLYDQGAIRALVVSRDACWTLPARAHLVVVMATQYVRLMPSKAEALGTGRKIEGLADRRLTDYSLPELVRMSSFAVRPGAATPGECVVMCQGDQVAYLQRMLSSGLPLESSLHEDRAASLLAPLLLEVAAGRVTTPAALVDMLSWTFLACQAQHNPSYYDCGADIAASLSDIADALFDELEAMRCVVRAGGAYSATSLGQSLARDPFAFTDLVSLHRAASSDAILAGQIATSIKHGSEPAADEAGAAAETAVLDATRASIPGEWLAAANVPRLPRRGAAAADAPVANGDGTAAPTEAALTPAQRRALLLVAYFACRPVGGAKTDAAHRGARERLQDEQAALVRALLRTQHKRVNGRGKGK